MKKNGFSILIFLFILCLTIAFCGFILAESEEDIKKASSFKAPGVAVVRLQKMDYRLKIPARGIVRAEKYADIRSEITGKIKTVSPGVYAGARVTQGDVLFALCDRQYRLQLQEAEAACLAAEQSLRLEQGRQIVARHQWQMLSSPKKQSHTQKDLALRRPQLITCRAELQKAQARLDLMQYNLARTQIQAPCNGIILEKSVCLGMLAGPGTKALRLACDDTLHIVAKFAAHMAVDPTQPAAQISIGKETWQGRVKSLLPGCDPATGQKAVLVQFKAKAPDILNCYASVTLNGTKFHGVYVIGRDAVRPGNTVWLLDEKDSLAIMPFTFLGRDRHHVVARGLKPDTRLILSHLSNPMAGMALRPLQHKTLTPDRKIHDDL